MTNCLLGLAASAASHVLNPPFVKRFDGGWMDGWMEWMDGYGWLVDGWMDG